MFTIEIINLLTFNKAPAPAAAVATPEAVAAPAAAAGVAAAAAVATPVVQTGDRLKASPYAKKLASEKNVPLNQLAGSGPGGRIVANDVNSYVPSATPAAAPAQAAAAAPVSAPAGNLTTHLLWVGHFDVNGTR